MNSNESRIKAQKSDHAIVLEKTNKRLVLIIGVIITTAMIWAFTANRSANMDFEAPLFDNLGDYKWEVTTKSKDARRFFNQGLIMANGFNHMEAARSFREAIRLDSSCAMAYWGLAYVLGPNYNTSSMMTEDRKEIIQAVRKADELKGHCQPWEQALIDAIKVKFPPEKDEVQEVAYSEAMKMALQRNPQNDGIATLYAESIMNLHAWDLYEGKGGPPKPWTPEIVAALEKAIEINTENPLANHLYIHAIEASANPERAKPSARRLSYLVPGSGHLVHMPSHIYINTGDYHEGSLANETAVIVDSIYIAKCKAQGAYPQLYYPHNYHFLAATAALEGRGGRAIEAAFKMADIIDRTYLDKPGYETTQHYITTPYNVLVKFSQWEKLIVLPQPRKDLVYPLAIWHYGRGMAYANLGDFENAKKELAGIRAILDEGALRKISIWEINSAHDVGSIAYEVLQGEIARVEKRYKEATGAFLKAIEIEDQLNYTEPPDWFFSVRHLLGDLYLRTGQPELAKQAFEEDLKVFPKNGFALNGLYHSYQMIGHKAKAKQTLKQFERAWQYADSELGYSRIDEENRRELILNFKYDSPDDLIYIAGTFCRIN